MTSVVSELKDMANKTDENRAKDIVGERAWEEMINAASGGQINSQQMRDIVWALPTDQRKNKLGGNHDRRMRERDTSADETEMKKIMADWFHYGDMPQDRVGALEVLIKVLEENGNQPLARDLKKINALSEENKHFAGNTRDMSSQDVFLASDIYVSDSESSDDGGVSMEVAEGSDHLQPLPSPTTERLNGSKQRDYWRTVKQTVKANAVKTKEFFWRGQYDKSERKNAELKELKEKSEKEKRKLEEKNIELTELVRTLSIRKNTSTRPKVSIFIIQFY